MVVPHCIILLVVFKCGMKDNGVTSVMTSLSVLMRLMLYVISWDGVEHHHIVLVLVMGKPTTILYVSIEFIHRVWGEILYNSSAMPFLDRYGTDNLPTVIDDLSCSLSSYLTIFQCSYSSSIDSGCSNDNDVAVTCCKSFNDY